jgi:hypothetical protein
MQSRSTSADPSQSNQMGFPGFSFDHPVHNGFEWFLTSSSRFCGLVTDFRISE